VLVRISRYGRRTCPSEPRYRPRPGRFPYLNGIVELVGSVGPFEPTSPGRSPWDCTKHRCTPGD